MIYRSVAIFAQRLWRRAPFRLPRTLVLRAPAQFDQTAMASVAEQLAAAQKLVEDLSRQLIEEQAAKDVEGKIAAYEANVAKKVRLTETQPAKGAKGSQKGQQKGPLSDVLVDAARPSASATAAEPLFRCSRR